MTTVQPNTSQLPGVLDDLSAYVIGGRVTLKLGRPDGSAADQLFSRRDGDLFKHASRSDWGSSL